jgi:hypothetical protein
MWLTGEGDYCCPWSLFHGGAGRSWARNEAPNTFGVESKILCEEVK